MSSAYYPLPIVIEKDGSNEKAYDLYSRLLKDRIIFLGTEINDNVANAVIAQLLFLETQDPEADIYMYINSPGGIVTSGLGIYDTMQYIKPDINTVCVGQAASMACFLLSAGQKGKRFSLPNSRIMMHQARGGTSGAAPDVTVHYEEMMRVNDLLLRLFAESTGRPYEQVKIEVERDKYMSPLQAKEFGIVDAIHTGSMRSRNE